MSCSWSCHCSFLKQVLKALSIQRALVVFSHYFYGWVACLKLEIRLTSALVWVEVELRLSLAKITTFHVLARKFSSCHIFPMGYSLPLNKYSFSWINIRRGHYIYSIALFMFFPCVFLVDIFSQFFFVLFGSIKYLSKNFMSKTFWVEKVLDPNNVGSKKIRSKNWDWKIF